MTNTAFWSTEEVAEYMETLGLGSYEGVFRENDINGEVLPHLTESHLKELGMKSIGHRITFMQWLQTLQKPADETKPRKEAKKAAHVRDYPPQEDAYSYKRQTQPEQPAAAIAQDAAEDIDEYSSKGSSWEKKRRAAIAKRLGSETTGGSKRRNPNPEMDFGFEEPSKTKKNNRSDSGEDAHEKPLKFNPNPFSREDDDQPPYQPPKRAQPKKSSAFQPATAQPQQSRQRNAKPQQQFNSDPESEPHSTNDDNFDGFGEDDVPPMGGCKLGGMDQPWQQQQQSRPAYQQQQQQMKPQPKTMKPASRQPQQPQQPAEAYNDDDGFEVSGNRVECSVCHRKFAEDRIEKHEKACQQAASRKKKVFDSTKMRVQGTEAAQFQGISKDEPPKKKSNYKAVHEALVANMRAARELTKYEEAKAQGKAVGPPPVQPKYELPNDDRVECPYCGRKFGSDAADRHISFCERQNAGKMRAGKTQLPPKRGGRR